MMRARLFKEATRNNTRFFKSSFSSSTHALMSRQLNGMPVHQEIITKHETLSRGTGSGRPAKRLKFSYVENQTAALSLDVTTQELEDTKQDPLELLAESKERILHHAAIRVDCFFYILLAYYNTHYTPVMAHTFLQFGRGRNSLMGDNITQACHSSFFGAFNDNSPQKQDESARYGHSILTGTHFLHSLNATVELPWFVNQLDDELENVCGCRTNGLKIITDVSFGRLTPVEGLNQFFLMMEQAFKDIENLKTISRKSKPYLHRDTASSPLAIKKPLIDLVTRGTFHHKWNPSTRRVENDYIEMLLRLDASEKIQCRNSEAYRMKCYERKIAEIQLEILQPENDSHSCRVT